MRPKTDKVALWFVRILCGGILLIFLGHYGHVKLFTENKVEISGDEAGVLIISLSCWVVYESVREFLKKKLEEK